MRVVILTSSPRDFAVECLPHLAKAEGVDIAMIVLSHQAPVGRSKKLQRQARKVRKIGLFGAINGVRMRRWYAPPESQKHVADVASELGIRLEETPRINCDPTKALFSEAKADLGLSLGNGYIGSGVFTIPDRGMVNVHHELLPEMQGAQSIIWQLYHNSLVSGFTIHRIDRQIDTGHIILRREMPIELQDTLEDTVRHNYRRLRAQSAIDLAKVVADYDRFEHEAQPQGPGNRYTTPSIWQYFRIRRNFLRLRAG